MNKKTMKRTGIAASALLCASMALAPLAGAVSSNTLYTIHGNEMEAKNNPVLTSGGLYLLEAPRGQNLQAGTLLVDKEALASKVEVFAEKFPLDLAQSDLDAYKESWADTARYLSYDINDWLADDTHSELAENYIARVADHDNIERSQDGYETVLTYTRQTKALYRQNSAVVNEVLASKPTGDLLELAKIGLELEQKSYSNDSQMLNAYRLLLTANPWDEDGYVRRAALYTLRMEALEDNYDTWVDAYLATYYKEKSVEVSAAAEKLLGVKLSPKASDFLTAVLQETWVMTDERSSIADISKALPFLLTAIAAAPADNDDNTLSVVTETAAYLWFVAQRAQEGNLDDDFEADYPLGKLNQSVPSGDTAWQDLAIVGLSLGEGSILMLPTQTGSFFMTFTDLSGEPHYWTFKVAE